MAINNRLPLSLLLLRLSIFLVMFMWTIDKFLRPEHAASIYENFYFIRSLGSIFMFSIATIELIIIVGFLLGIQKRLTYGLVLLLHGISTISSFKQYLAPFIGPNLLFFAAWPMLAACFALYYLRDNDTLCSYSNK
jgi:putative oxidoreductase